MKTGQSSEFISPVIMELRVQAETFKLQRKLANFLLQSVGPGGQEEITLFENELGHSLRATHKKKFIFAGPEGRIRSTFSETPMEDFIEWCTYFYAPEFAAYVEYDDTVLTFEQPQIPPTTVWLHENKLAAIVWIINELEELSLMLAELELAEHSVDAETTKAVTHTR